MYLYRHSLRLQVFLISLFHITNKDKNRAVHTYIKEILTHGSAMCSLQASKHKLFWTLHTSKYKENMLKISFLYWQPGGVMSVPWLSKQLKTYLFSKHMNDHLFNFIKSHDCVISYLAAPTSNFLIMGFQLKWYAQTLIILISLIYF